jgi:hypothetical protein
MAHELIARHDPHVYQQVRSCAGDEHATHRELTGLVLHFCNCGYSSGWVDKSTLPPPDEFIREHRPQWAVGL